MRGEKGREECVSRRQNSERQSHQEGMGSYGPEHVGKECGCAGCELKANSTVVEGQQSYVPVLGVNSLGLHTTVLPHMIAGATWGKHRGGNTR